MAKGSILQDDMSRCWVCGSMPTVWHHIYFGGKRKISDENGFIVGLCPYHHNMSNEGVHFNRELDLEIKRACERKWLEITGKEISDFIKLVGKNYL